MSRYHSKDFVSHSEEASLWKTPRDSGVFTLGLESRTGKNKTSVRTYTITSIKFYILIYKRGFAEEGRGVICHFKSSSSVPGSVLTVGPLRASYLLVKMEPERKMKTVSEHRGWVGGASPISLDTRVTSGRTGLSGE